MTTTNPSSVSHSHPVLQLWKPVVFSGVLALALGAVVLAWPGKTLLVAAALFGVYGG